MKTIPVLLLLSAIVFVFAAGCTSNQSAPQTTVTTAAATKVTTTATAEPSDLAGSWTLSLMAIQRGTVIQRPTAAISLTVWPDGTLAGYSGCNNYNAAYTLGGEMTEKGSAIAVGPIAATKKYCEQLAGEETTYLAILQDAMAYTVNGDKLTITAHDGTALSFVAVKPA